MALLAAGLVLAACGGDEPADEAAAGCATVSAGEVTVVAEDLAWDPKCIEAPAKEPFTIVVDNRDDGIAHNIHLLEAPEPNATELENGPVTQELELTLVAGEYRYVCDIHPNMTGTLSVG
ncbi:hypothetical protein BH20ACT2_BH20ACT2_21420 [soil metagenome]